MRTGAVRVDAAEVVARLATATATAEAAPPVAIPALPTVLCFAIVCVAAASAAEQLRKLLRLPLITGYILAGLLCGPHVLELLLARDCALLSRIIINDAMGFIGFAAGSKFLLSELRGSLRPVLSLLGGLVAVTYVLVACGVWLASPYLDLTSRYAPAQRLAITLVLACLAVARSPSSAIALVSELGAQGPFTTAALSVTVLMDVVVVLIFALSLLLVRAVAPEPGASAAPIGQTLGLFGGQLAISGLVGVLLGRVLHWVLRLTSAGVDGADSEGQRAHGKLPGTRRAALLGMLWLIVKVVIMLAESAAMQLVGYEIFAAEEWEEASLGIGMHQPLVICMVAGFVVVNFTASRIPFLRILHDSSEPVYIAFFTLTGATLELQALLPNLPAAALVFCLRLCGIAAGSYWGGRLGGSARQHYDRYWMAFITQAGVTLGLAQKVSREFAWGPELATTVTAIVVINQLVGPMLFKTAILGVGEAHPSYAPGEGASPLGLAPPTRPKPRSAVVVSIDGDAMAAALRDRLRRRDWQVVHCDATFTPADSPAPSPAPFADRRARRFEQLAKATDPSLRALISRTSPSSSPNPGNAAAGAAARAAAGAAAGAGLAEPLMVATDGGPALGGLESGLGGGDGLSETTLLWAISALPSLDVLLLLLPDDAENLRLAKLLQSSASLLPLIHQRQTASPQLLVRVTDPSFDAAYARLPLPAFRLTLVHEAAALPNLFAEVLHPECHWTCALDNGLPQHGEGISARPTARSEPLKCTVM